jgi:Uma2 family endonuclease
MRAVTRAAEGFDRRAFTVSEILRMQDAGIISEQENFELIEGEIVPMQAKSHIHELMKSAFNYALVPAVRKPLWLGVETTIYLSDDTFVEPDFAIYPRGMKLENVRGPDIVLAIEIAVTSLAYDREFKAGLYAKHKMQEYWVVDAAARRTHQFGGPRGKGWRRRGERGPDETLTHPALPDFSIRLADI